MIPRSRRRVNLLEITANDTVGRVCGRRAEGGEGGWTGQVLGAAETPPVGEELMASRWVLGVGVAGLEMLLRLSLVEE